MAAVNSLYPSLSENELNSIIESKNKTTTKLIIQNAVRVFSDFILQKQELGVKSIDDCYTVRITELDDALTAFYAAVRQRNGEIYMKKSMISLRYGLQRHFDSTRNINIINDIRFRPSNEMFAAVLVKLKMDGKDIIRHKQPIMADDRQKLYDMNVLGIDNPTCLQRKVFFDMVFHLCKRGREDLHVMKKSNYQVTTDSNGLKYVHQNTHYLAKNRLDERDARMYELAGDRLCPVMSFVKYISKLSPRNPNLWQRPKQGVVGEGYPVWYLNVNMGHNALGSMMRNISIAANLSQIYTNQCIRATSNLELDRKWYEFREIMTDDFVNEGMKRRISWELTSSITPNKRQNLPPMFECETQQQSVTNAPSQLPGMVQRFPQCKNLNQTTALAPCVQIKQEVQQDSLNEMCIPNEYIMNGEIAKNHNLDSSHYERPSFIMKPENRYNLTKTVTADDETFQLHDGGRNNSIVFGVSTTNSIMKGQETSHYYIEEALVIDEEDKLVETTEESNTEIVDLTEEELCPLSTSDLLLLDDEENAEEREEIGIKTPYKRLSERHFIAVNKGKTPLGHPSKPHCIVCSDKAVKRHRTEFICEQCILPMCPIPCFKRYHTLVEYKARCSQTYHSS